MANPEAGRSAFWAWMPSLVLFLLFLGVVFHFPILEGEISGLIRRKAVFVNRGDLPVLAMEHGLLVIATSGGSAILAFGGALVLSSRRLAGLREFFLDAASVAETIPSAAIMAILVPATGYGFMPVAAALFLYGLLPVFRNTLVGLASTPPELEDAGRAMGMREAELLRLVRLPLAAPLIVQGLRVNIIVTIAAASLGAAVGAGGLGVPIVSGLRAFDPVRILEGALPLALLSLAADSALRALEQRLSA